MEFKICEENLEKVDRKLTALGKKCAKAQMEFHYARKGEVFEPVKLEDGTTEIVRFIIVEVSGKLIRSGWEFICNVQSSPGGNIIKGYIGKEHIPAEYFTQDLHCDHCHYNRPRKYATVVRNVDTGEYKMLGTACVKEYTTGLSAELIAEFMSGYTTLEAGYTVGESTDTYYSVSEALPTLVALVNEYGFISASKAMGTDETSTKRRILDYAPFTQKNPKNISIDQDILQEAEAIVHYYSNLDATDAFSATMKSMFSCGYFDRRTLGYFCYAVTGYRKYMEDQKAQKERESHKNLSTWIGEVGHKVCAKVQSCKCVYRDVGQFGDYFLYQFIDDHDNVLMWGTSKNLMTDEVTSISGTIKSLDTYKDEKQTILTRCRVQYKTL